MSDLSADVGSYTRAAVVGAGVMGRGIAQLLLQAGLEVVLVDPSEAATREASSSLHELFGRLAAKGKLAESPGELMARLTTASDLQAAAAAQWLFEAAPEDLELKRELFARAAVVAPQAILATNTSTLSVTAIAAATQRPSEVVGMHFFNPPGVMRLVEVVPGMLTRGDIVAAARAMALRLGREPVVTRDSPGFIVNRLARPFYLHAVRLHAAGFAAADVDAIMRSAGFRQGPFELLDLIGLDVNLAASLNVYRAFFEEPRYRPHPLQQAMVTAGLLGRKVGRGFYRYDESGRKVDPAAGQLTAGPAMEGRRRAAPAGRIAVIGDNSAATALRELLGQAAAGSDETPPALTLDARLEPPADEVARLLAAGATLGVLSWSRSASAAAGVYQAAGYPGSLIGFSLVPAPEGARPLIELTMPEPAAPVADGHEAKGSAASRPQPAAQEPVARARRALDEAQAVLAAAGVGSVVVPDSPGGVAFATVALLANEAIGAAAEGLAGRGELDRAMQLGVNYPLGPLAWAEQIGLRELHDALRGLHAETLESRFAPHPYLTRLAAVGAVTVPDIEAPVPSRQAPVQETTDGGVG